MQKQSPSSVTFLYRRACLLSASLTLWEQIFWLGIRRIVARGVECSHHENVVFLDVLPSIFDQLLGLIRHLPDKWQPWLESRLPELFLPQKLILKREKVNWEDNFDNEKRVYQALTPVQGRVVPRCYGQVKCPRTARTGTRALLLSDIGGMTLDRKATRSIGMERLEDMLWVAIRAVAALGVGHDDYKLTNYRLVGGQTDGHRLRHVVSLRSWGGRSRARGRIWC